MARLPNCFLVGAPKAGTTSLYYYLAQHPQIYMSPIKEPNFFASEIRLENFEPRRRRVVARDARELRRYMAGPMQQRRLGALVTEWEDYTRLFANACGEPVLGEASVCYLWSSTAASQIHARLPHAKILIMLRHPADRAFSDYLQGLSSGSIRWSLREQIQRNLKHASGKLCVHYPFLELGMYTEQVRRYLDCFGDNVWVGLYDDFASRPAEVFRSICQFLDIDGHFTPDMARKHHQADVPRLPAIAWLRRLGIWKAAAQITPRGLRPLIHRQLVRAAETNRMDDADRRYLVSLYRDDILRLADLLGRNLDHWLQE